MHLMVLYNTIDQIIGAVIDKLQAISDKLQVIQLQVQLDIKKQNQFSNVHFNTATEQMQQMCLNYQNLGSKFQKSPIVNERLILFHGICCITLPMLNIKM
uniref:Uncharacterized protein n=1 Tax=Romanomermis culicivorax TaxID=13658 RepID=A0A915HY83_ROMCU